MREFKFKAKIQQMSYNTDGKPRFFIYISKAAFLLNLKKGERIDYSINGIEKVNINNLSKKIPQKQIICEDKEIPQEPLEDTKKIEPTPLELTEEEEEFLVKYKNTKGLPVSDFILKSAIAQFGEKRVNKLLEVKE